MTIRILVPSEQTVMWAKGRELLFTVVRFGRSLWSPAKYVLGNWFVDSNVPEFRVRFSGKTSNQFQGES